jgi:pimeloyl-ACP methyl ester carboxylesterase
LGESSSQESRDYRLTAQAEWIRRFLDRARLDRVHVLGHDLGGVVAMALATRYPHRVVKLILSQTPPRSAWVHPMVEMLRATKPNRGPARRISGLWHAFGKPAKRGRPWALFSQEIDRLGPQAAPLWKPWVDGSHGSDLNALLAAMEPLMDEEVEEALHHYQRPTMLLWGCDFPPLSPSWAIQLYHDIPGAKRFELIPFAGHFPQWENPERFARAVLDFLVPKRGPL